MHSEQPLLTVAIPTYKSVYFLDDAIGSVMRQDLPSIEIVIVDNDSRDGTEDYVRGLENPYVRYFQNITNLGSRENLNCCLAKARGQYIKFLCADDVFTEGVLLKQMDVLRRRADVSLVTCNLTMTDHRLCDGKTYRQYPGTCSGLRMINLCLSGLGNYIGGPSSIMFRRADAAGLSFDSSYKLIADLKFGLQLLQRGAYTNIDEVGYLYRRHANTDSATNCPDGISMAEYFRLVDEFNWWNPLNCLQAIRRGGLEGRDVVYRHWQQACLLSRVSNGLKSFKGVWNMRYGGS